MSLSKEQIAEKLKWRTHFHIWERDLLYMAQQYPAWCEKAFELGFTDAKINAPWTFSDAGRLIQYMENPYFGRQRSQRNDRTELGRPVRIP